MKRGLDDSAIAYGWLVLSIFFIIAGILYAVLSGMFTNDILNGPEGDQSIGINHDISKGYLSSQAVGAINFNVEMEKNIPLFICIGGFIFAIARAIVVKQ